MCLDVGPTQGPAGSPYPFGESTLTETHRSGRTGRQEFSLYGLRVRSGVNLPGWPVLETSAQPDLTIVREAVELPLPEGPPYSAYSLLQNGELRLGVRGVARYRASGGCLIQVDPEPGAKSEDIQLYLTGTVLSAILHQRNRFPLHASCVSLGGQGIALAGPSGAGKSTLVTALIARGATFVSDDICVLAPLPGDRFGVWPSAPRTKLDLAALASLEQSDQGLEPAGGERAKFHLPVSSPAAQGTPVALHRVYLLRDAEAAPQTEQLEGLEAVAALVDETYFLRYAVGLGLAAQCFRQAAELARRVQVVRLRRPRGFQHLAVLVELIEAEARDAAAG